MTIENLKGQDVCNFCTNKWHSAAFGLHFDLKSLKPQWDRLKLLSALYQNYVFSAANFKLS